MRKITTLLFILAFTISGFGLQKNQANKVSEEREILETRDPLRKASLYIKYADRRIHQIQLKGENVGLKEKREEEELCWFGKKYLKIMILCSCRSNNSTACIMCFQQRNQVQHPAQNKQPRS